jgi:hypothetical protein
MKKLTACLSVIILLASCESGKKQVIVLSEGSADINTDDRTITTKGRGHEEKTVIFYEGDNMDLKVSSQAGNATVPLKENGIYILNTKRDTIVGSFVNYAAPKTEVKRLSVDEVNSYIDSLEAIVAGKVKPGKTFFILPNQAVWITGNQNATIVTPYHQMSSISVNKGEAPEVYRFYPIKESRATLEKLKGESTQPVND